MKKFFAMAMVISTMAGCAGADAGNTESEQFNDSDESVAQSEDSVIAATDYDYTTTASRSYTGLTLTFKYNAPIATYRNNKVTTVSVTYRNALDGATIRKPLSNFGAGTVTNAGVPSYAVTSTIKFNPSTIGVGTYYLYLTYTTNGDDRKTYIYKVSVTA